MPGTWQKQKVKDIRIDLEKFNRSHLRNPPSLNCYQRQNITTEYFHFLRRPSRVVHIFEMVKQLISRG